MFVRAKQRLLYGGYGKARNIRVVSNPFGALQNKPLFRLLGLRSIRVYLQEDVTHTAMHQESLRSLDYETITDFLFDWKIVKAQTHIVRVPFLRRVVGGGDAFAFFAEKLPLWFKMKFNGCLDRREWWNHWLRFVPLKRENALVTQVIFDDVMDVRRVLRDRGENPFDYDGPPVCDVCGTWVGTHVIGEIIVCDKTRCQDRVTSYYKEHGVSYGD